MQVLWESELIDGKNLLYYHTLTRRQDADEIFNLDSSLRHIMSRTCTAVFLKEKGMMSTMG
jgi:hypothetical protein